MAKQRKITLPTARRLEEAERQTTSMALPAPIHYRLDELARLTRNVRATRAEIMGMLIANSGMDAGDLQRKLLAYRDLTVGEVMDSDSGDVVVPIHGPGRRKQDASS